LNHAPSESIILESPDTHEVLIKSFHLHGLPVVGQLIINECPHVLHIGVARNIQLLLGALFHDVQAEAEVLRGAYVLIGLRPLGNPAGLDDAVDHLDPFLLAEYEGRIELDVPGHISGGKHPIYQRR